MNMTKQQKNEMLIMMVNGQYKPNSEEKEVLIEYLYKENEMLENKKKNATAKREAKKGENDTLKEEILTCLSNSTGMTATEVYVMCGLKNSQQATRLLCDLLEDGKVERTKEKGKSIYKVA